MYQGFEIMGNSCLLQGKLASIKAKFLQQIKNDDCLMEVELMWKLLEIDSNS